MPGRVLKLSENYFWVLLLVEVLLPVLLAPVLPVALLLPLPAELLSLLVSLPALVMASWPRLLLWLEDELEPLWLPMPMEPMPL